MNKSEVFKGLLVGLAFVAPSVQAQDYPAADFQPKVLFQDESVKTSKSVGGSSNAPCVSQSASQPANATVVDQQASFDPAYPAANFQPKVIFSDAN